MKAVRVQRIYLSAGGEQIEEEKEEAEQAPEMELELNGPKKNLKYVIINDESPVNRYLAVNSSTTIILFPGYNVTIISIHGPIPPRYIFLDKSRRQLDIRIEKKVSLPRPALPSTDFEETRDVSRDTPASDQSDNSLVIVNIYRDNLLHKSYHQVTPS